ncbi:MAG TPA: nicotinate-nucleotide--dimethylbenzimidazole phosphoribosyltransferase [Jatrophihabitans sp.]|uniref:nicotinate-nucleotide--dimethylbenzimidazole phosphoribosyltransferase n=1 Tax=Jatrophihabitans sp. TaxID=1932789 RepID=UPI002E04EEDD|nr:nicotinate-nucleotide--dimethylbenzimidazole phosphoribosyltransferase [Jatrophihabitans sp.]
MTDLASEQPGDAVGTTGVLGLGADIDWPDAGAAERARGARPGPAGRLPDLVEWLATTQGRFPPTAPHRPRLVAFGRLPAAAAALAQASGVGVREIRLDSGTTVARALSLGAAAADAEVDAGADLAVVSAAGDTRAAAVLVGLLTGAEPVALLPRGPAAADTAAWIRAASALRDRRREVVSLRSQPDQLLDALADPELGAVVGFVLRATARRTPLILDGPIALAAAVLAHDVQSRATRWWRVADSSPDPVQSRAVRELHHEPLLGLDTAPGDGVAGVLAVAVLNAAVRVAEQWGDEA